MYCDDNKNNTKITHLLVLGVVQHQLRVGARDAVVFCDERYGVREGEGRDGEGGSMA